jgi:hypothetical protein
MLRVGVTSKLVCGMAGRDFGSSPMRRLILPSTRMRLMSGMGMMRPMPCHVIGQMVGLRPDAQVRIEGDERHGGRAERGFLRFEVAAEQGAYQKKCQQGACACSRSMFADENHARKCGIRATLRPRQIIVRGFVFFFLCRDKYGIRTLGLPHEIKSRLDGVSPDHVDLDMPTVFPEFYFLLSWM